MRLPEGVSFNPRQQKLLAKDEQAIVRIDTLPPAPLANDSYVIHERNLQLDIRPFVHGDWKELDHRFPFIPENAAVAATTVAYSGAAHRPSPDGTFRKLPNITVVPNFPVPHPERRLYVLGCTMGHFHRPEPVPRVQEVYEFQSHGLLVIDHQRGNVEMWVAKGGDKVVVPTGCYMTLYNLGDHDHPLVTLDFADPSRNFADKKLASECGPILLAYYDDTVATFTLNLPFINHSFQDIGVRLPTTPRPTRARQVEIARGARIDLGKLLYERLTQDPAIISQFSRLGIAIRTASPEAVLQPLGDWAKGRCLYVSRPLAEAADVTRPVSDFYRFFFPACEEAQPGAPSAAARPPAAVQTDARAAEPTSLERPLVVLVEGAGEWVVKAYRDPLGRLQKEHQRVAIFYADDSRWKAGRPPWVEALQPWEVYLDKADPVDHVRYLALRPDVVFVVTPDSTHASVAGQWLGKAATVFVEKPFDSELSNVEELRMRLSHQRSTEVRGLDHYQFYCLPLHALRGACDELFDGACARVEFVLAEKQAMGADRVRTLQHGLTLDLLPHFLALMTFFGDVGSIDDLVVLEASQYEPWGAGEDAFRNETASRLGFSFEDFSENGFRVPCIATVGKGFARDVKYLEITGRSGHLLRADFGERPEGDPNETYPWGHLFFFQGDLDLEAKYEAVPVNDPYRPGRQLRMIVDPADRQRLRKQRETARYAPLFQALVEGTPSDEVSGLSLIQSREIVRALDRIWWAIQESKPWSKYTRELREPLDIAAPVRRDDLGRLAPVGSRPRPLALPRDWQSLATPGIRTHGARKPLPIAAGAGTTLYGLAKLLGQRSPEFPLTVLVYGHGSPDTDEFLVQVERALPGRGDAIWTIPAGGAAPPAASRRAVALDLDRETDRRIHANLVAHLAFFPALETLEDEWASALRCRAHAVVVCRRGPLRGPVVAAARAAGLDVLLWDGGPTLLTAEAGGPEGPVIVAGGAQEPAPAMTPAQLEEKGQRLTAFIAEIGDDEDSRRNLLRLALDHLLATYREHPHWYVDLARLAHTHRWPRWAVQSLPKAFVPLPDPSPGVKAALVSRLLLAAASTESYRAEPLCGGELLEIATSNETAEALAALAAHVERRLRENPFGGEGAFVGTVAEALEDYGNGLKGADPAAAQRLEAARATFLVESNVISRPGP